MKTSNGLAAAALAALLLAGPAVAGRDGGESWYVEAPVVSVEPLVRYVRVSTPERHCWHEEVERHVRERGRGPRTETIVGALVGGAVGHNIGDGDHRVAGRVAGAILGAAIGRDIGARRDRTRRIVTTERVCEVDYVSREEERIDGYRVVYRYDGRRFVTRTQHDPGPTIRVRVRVAPVHYNGRH